MKFPLLLLSFLLAAASICAQDSERLTCPVLRVIGPAAGPSEKLPAGSTAKFTARFEPKKPEYQLTYHWTLSSGKIIAGQGTKTIEVEPGIHYVSATVNITGFRGEEMCPRTVSETVWWNVPPAAEKLDTFSLPLSSVAGDLVRRIRGAISNEPSSQIYILVPKDKALRDALVDRLSSERDLPKVSIIEANGANKVAEVWLVPPGTMPPSKCEACERLNSAEQDCPKISILGPAGLTFAGNIMRFIVNEPLGFTGTYKWTVSDGSIESGQGTQSIDVRTPDDRGSNITATVELSGLPDKCANKASETAGSYRDYLPVAADVYGRLPRNEEMVRLQSAFAQLRKEPDFVAVIIIHVPRPGKITFVSRVQTIKRYLTLLREDTSKAVFVDDDGSGQLSTTIYLVPRSAISLTKR